MTLEEQHSTRGRAHMLFEMLQGEVIDGGWQNEARQGVARPVPVLQGLQVGVPGERRHGDVSRGVSVALLRGQPAAAARVRVRADRSSGCGSAPSRRALANALIQAPGLTGIAKTFSTSRPSGELPASGARRLSVDGRGHGRRRDVPGARATTSDGDVILWVDTFNNSFYPETAPRRARSA